MERKRHGDPQVEAPRGFGWRSKLPLEKKKRLGAILARGHLGFDALLDLLSLGRSNCRQLW